ncbi:MAG: hypothetical protein DRO99_02940 [Candidatus Aenigmatarchaeota archaeon]|nr:MAG: hypothetical protein DRO99_02940 [Candidatus Aenigmarchaeota archaeon]
MPKQVYVITGGPCVGKTTILNDLKKKGYHVMHEIARKIIEEQQATGGDILPWKDINRFQEVLLENHLKHESELPEEIVFIDRGIGDILAYCEVYGIDPPKDTHKHGSPPRYHKIILLDQLPSYEKDDVRKEDPEMARKIHESIEKVYRKLGYDIINVPPLPPEKRLQWLIKEIRMDTHQ